MLERPIWLNYDFLILINNEEEYNKIQLILHSYGFQPRIKNKTFRSYVDIYYYLRIQGSIINQGSQKSVLDEHKYNIKQILTYDDIIKM